MGIDIASWRIYIGSFLSTHMASTNPLCKSTKATKWSSYRRSTILLSFVLLAFASSLTICMDIEPNPGPHPIVTSRQPTTAASDPTTPYTYTSLFNATKRIYLKLTRHKHHLLNYSFYKENNYIPASLYPRLPPLYMNYKFYRRWRYISHSAAYRHLKLLITECKHKIKTLSMELLHHMELLRYSCTSDEFLFYSTKLDSMALSLESLLGSGLFGTSVSIRRITDNNTGNTDNSHINPQVNSITNNHETSIGTHDNISNSTQSSNVTPTRKRLRRKIKPTNIQLDHSSVINLSSYSLSTDETSVLARGLTFCPTPRHIDWPEVSADIYDFSRRMRLTEYFFDDNSKTSNSNKDDTPFHNKSTWNPPNDRERTLDTFLDAVKLDITTCTPNKTRDNLTITERQAISQLKQ